VVSRSPYLGEWVDVWNRPRMPRFAWVALLVVALLIASCLAPACEAGDAVAQAQVALDVLTARAGLQSTVILLVKAEAPASVLRKGQGLAWTYPADAYLEGPGGSIAIALRESLLPTLTLGELMHVIAHEVGHAALDIEAIRRGEVMNCRGAERMGRRLLTGGRVSGG